MGRDGPCAGGAGRRGRGFEPESAAPVCLSMTGPMTDQLTPPKKRILLVEDHVDTAKGLAWLLTRAGYEVRTVHAASAALLAAAEKKFDVVVSDVGLPDGSGFDLMRELNRCHGVPGIALTGYDRAEDLEQGRQSGFVAHLVKPVNLDQLRAALDRVFTAPRETD